MSIDKTAQLNWLRRLKDRNRNNSESGQELSFNEQEQRDLQETERKDVDAERQRVDRLVEESRKRTEEVGRPENVPGKFQLSRNGIENVLTMDANTLWNALCVSFENCSPYVSEDTVARGKMIRYIVENRSGYPLGWGSMLRSIDFLFQGLELDAKSIVTNNVFQMADDNWAKSYFTNERWLRENERLLQNEISNAIRQRESREDRESNFKNFMQELNENGQLKAAIKIWAFWHASAYGQFDISNYIRFKDSSWGQFKDFLQSNSGIYTNQIGRALSKQYLPLEMQNTNDGVHAIETNIFNVLQNLNLKDENNLLKTWDVEKWKFFIRDLYIMTSTVGIELKGRTNLTNIDGKNVFFNMTQKVMMIENIANKDPFISNVFKRDTRIIIPYSLYQKVDEDVKQNALGPMASNVSALQQIEANRYGGYRRETASASDENLRNSDYMSEDMKNLLLYLEAGPQAYSMASNWYQYRPLFEKQREALYEVWKSVRDKIKNPDVQRMTPEEVLEYTREKINSLQVRDFGSDSSKKAREEQILDAPFEHSSRISASNFQGNFPGSGVFSPHTLPERKSIPLSFNIAVYPKRKENDPQGFVQVFQPGGSSSTGGLNFHHHSINTLNDEGHYSHAIGWIGGFVDIIGKNMYIAELQSDIMQNTSFMKDPEKSRSILNEDLKKYQQELAKEKENLAKQSAEGIDAYYEKRIKDLEKKRDAANNDNMKQQMDTAIQKLTEQKNAKEDPWGKQRKKIQDIENVIAEILNQLKELAEYESNTQDSWRKRPQFADVKSKIENRFSEWIDVFWNEIFYYCAKLEIKNLWISHSEHLTKNWRSFATPDTINMWKKIYDKRAQEFGAENKGDWWHLDLTSKMPKYASTNWYQRTKNGMV